MKMIKTTIVKDEDFKLRIVDSGILESHLTSCGFQVEIEQGNNSVVIDFDVYKRKIICKILKKPRYNREFTVIQFMKMLRTNNKKKELTDVEIIEQSRQKRKAKK